MKKGTFTTPQAIMAISEINIPFAKSLLLLFESVLNNNNCLIEKTKIIKKTENPIMPVSKRTLK